MQYALIIHEQPEEMAKRTSPEHAPAYWDAWYAYSQAVIDADIMRGGAGLETPDKATTVTLAEGGHEVHDGPFADSKEQLGGFFLIEVDSLDDALAWAAKIPSPGGKVEVRPVLPPRSEG